MRDSKIISTVHSPSEALQLWRVVLVSFLFFGASASSTAAEQQAQVSGTESLFGLESFLQMMFGLVVVVGIIVVLSIVIRRFSLLPGTTPGVIKIIGGLALNSKDRLLLIQVGEEQILISASPGRVGKVHDMQQAVNPESLKTPLKTDAVSFSSLLERVSRKAAQ